MALLTRKIKQTFVAAYINLWSNFTKLQNLGQLGMRLWDFLWKKASSKHFIFTTRFAALWKFIPDFGANLLLFTRPESLPEKHWSLKNWTFWKISTVFCWLAIFLDLPISKLCFERFDNVVIPDGRWMAMADRRRKCRKKWRCNCRFRFQTSQQISYNIIIMFAHIWPVATPPQPCNFQCVHEITSTKILISTMNVIICCCLWLWSKAHFSYRKQKQKGANN